MCPTADLNGCLSTERLTGPDEHPSSLSGMQSLVTQWLNPSYSKNTLFEGPSMAREEAYLKTCMVTDWLERRGGEHLQESEKSALCGFLIKTLKINSLQREKFSLSSQLGGFGTDLFALLL